MKTGGMTSQPPANRWDDLRDLHRPGGTALGNLHPDTNVHRDHRRRAIELIETPDGVVSDYFDEAVYYWLFPAAVVGVLGILPVWFVLATKQLVLSCVGLLAAGVCAGYWLGRFYDDPPSFWMPATITAVVAVVVSLLVVRSCGYRLGRLPARRISVARDRQDRSGSEEQSG